MTAPICLSLAMLIVTNLEAGDLARASFYTSLHAGNELTTEWAMSQPNTRESNPLLGQNIEARIGIHTASAITQFYIDKELSKSKYPKGYKWGFRVVSIAIQGWAMKKDLEAGHRARRP
jgi:hypothetical protein